MASTLALLVLAWAITVPLVLALGRLLGAVSTPRVEHRSEPVTVELPDNVVPLVARPGNGLEALRDAA